MTITSVNPATLEPLGAVEETEPAELPGIFAAARAAQQAWRELPACDRGSIVLDVNEIIAKKMDDISLLICREVGKPPGEAFISEVYGAMDATYYYYSIVDKVVEAKEPIDLRFYGSLDKTSHVVQKPAGVVAVIGPYNYPFAIPFSQIVQALMAGNAVVFKPSSDTPLVGQEIQALFDATSLPRHLLTTVFGSGGVIGNPMIDLANRVVFTGSTETGKHVMRRAASTLTPVSLELGGKSAMVVLPDANLDRAVLAARWGCFTNSGQVCASVKRLYLHESIKEDFTRRLVEATKALVQDYPEKPGVDVGAMINEHQMNLVLAAIERAKTEGATVLTGGRRKPGLKGYFIEPTILDGCTNRMACVQQEIFGPVLPVITFSDPAGAIAMVNDNPYGLTSSVWTADIEAGVRLAERIDTGTVMVNEVVYSFALAATPWGGVKHSGIGRTHGTHGFLELMNPLHVNVDRYAEPDAWWMPYDASFAETLENFKLIAKSLVPARRG